MLRCLLFLLGGVLPGAQLERISIPFGGRQIDYLYAGPGQETKGSPLLVILSAETQTVRTASAARGWRWVVPLLESVAAPWSDLGVKAIEAMVVDAWKRFGTDPGKTYLLGIGNGVNGVLYAASRAPDLWAAAAAMQGVPKSAIDTNRLFAANLNQVPLLFAVSGMDQTLRQRLAGVRVEWSSETLEGVLDFLGRHVREPHPKIIDCETGSAAFPRCYWLEITEFDFSRRNDVLKMSRILPGSGAFLDAGPFGYDAGDPGPGLTITMLPEGYQGPLKMGDRIVGVAGQRIGSAADYIRLMDQVTEEKPAALLIERGKQRLRIESRIRLPRREETVTARVRAEFQAETHDLLVVSRGVSGFRFVSVDFWTGATVNWNGRELGKVPGAGCWMAGSGAGLLPCAKP